MEQTREAIAENLAECLCWQAAHRDDSRVAQRLYRKQVVDGVLSSAIISSSFVTRSTSCVGSLYTASHKELPANQCWRRPSQSRQSSGKPTHPSKRCVSNDPTHTCTPFTGFSRRSHATRRKYSSAAEASPHLSLHHACGQEIQGGQESVGCYPNA